MEQNKNKMKRIVRDLLSKQDQMKSGVPKHGGSELPDQKGWSLEVRAEVDQRNRLTRG